MKYMAGNWYFVWLVMKVHIPPHLVTYIYLKPLQHYPHTTPPKHSLTYAYCWSRCIRLLIIDNLEDQPVIDVADSNYAVNVIIWMADPAKDVSKLRSCVRQVSTILLQIICRQRTAIAPTPGILTPGSWAPRGILCLFCINHSIQKWRRPYHLEPSINPTTKGTTAGNIQRTSHLGILRINPFSQGIWDFRPPPIPSHHFHSITGMSSSYRGLLAFILWWAPAVISYGNESLIKL